MKPTPTQRSAEAHKVCTSLGLILALFFASCSEQSPEEAQGQEAGVEKVDAGPKGAVVCFRNDDFANPAGLVEFFAQQAGTAKLRPDHKLVYMRQWKTPDDRLKGVRYLIGELVKIASA